MAHKSNPEKDFVVDVEGVGRFTFARRMMRDEIDIQREYADILGGVQPTAWLEVVGNWIAVFRVLTVYAPSDWDIDKMDPLDDDTYKKMNRVYESLREKELSFRRGNVQNSESQSA